VNKTIGRRTWRNQGIGDAPVSDNCARRLFVSAHMASLQPISSSGPCFVVIAIAVRGAGTIWIDEGQADSKKAAPREESHSTAHQRDKIGGQETEEEENQKHRPQQVHDNQTCRVRSMGHPWSFDPHRIDPPSFKSSS